MPDLPKRLLPKWRIDGVLTTLGPLRVGDGRDKAGRLSRVPGSEENPVQTVFTRPDGRAYLPGSSLKGFLRGYIWPRLQDPHRKAIFGYQTETGPGAGEGLGGALTVWDAPAADLPTEVSEPDWSPARATCVAPHVVIDRATGTARQKLLFHEEYVPAGVGFRVTLLVEGGELNGLTSEEIAATLLTALDDLEKSGACLGASQAEGWGRLAWKPTSIRRLTEEALRSWLQNPTAPLVERLATVDRAGLAAHSKLRPVENTGRWLHFDIDLHMSGPFLVNDASRVKQKGDGTSGKPNHYALRTRGDKALLPASSFHGSLRSHAERIARTIAGTAGGGPVHAPGPEMPDVRNKEELRNMDAVSCLFGAPGWRAPLHTTPFIAVGNDAAVGRQEFIAIDRFTGGGADALKFNAEAFTPNTAQGFTLRGSLRLDLNALANLMKHRDAPSLAPGPVRSWATPIYLLGFVLRDLREGDISFGFGRSKGYGACTATVRSAADWGSMPELKDGGAQLLRTLFDPAQQPSARNNR
jgi:CRISPR/Cas system CSM-associated protein Csm3 (group 7 of RAMP superfamily)